MSLSLVPWDLLRSPSSKGNRGLGWACDPVFLCRLPPLLRTHQHPPPLDKDCAPSLCPCPQTPLAPRNTHQALRGDVSSLPLLDTQSWTQPALSGNDVGAPFFCQHPDPYMEHALLEFGRAGWSISLCLLPPEEGSFTLSPRSHWWLIEVSLMTPKLSTWHTSLGLTTQGQGPNWAAGKEPSHRSESLSGQCPFSRTETCLEAKSSLPFEQWGLQVTGCLMLLPCPLGPRWH